MNKHLTIFGVVFCFLFLIFLMDNSSAQEIQTQTLDYFKTNSCALLKQTCENCTFINISVSIPPNQTTILVNQSMNRKTSTLWDFTFCNTSSNGKYIYYTNCYLNC